MPENHPEAGEQLLLVDALAQTAFAITSVLTRIAAENELSLTQLRMLAILRDRRPAMSALATLLGLERSTLSGLVERAEARGLVARGRSAGDARSFEVFLTEEGRSQAKRIEREVQLAVLPGTTGLSDEEQRALRMLLERVLTHGRE